MTRMRLFLNIYKNIAPKIFFGGFATLKGVDDYGWPIRALIHLALLPISLTLVAGFFALFHALTRKPLLATDMNTDKEAFDKFSDEEITQLSSKLESRQGCSSSSKNLLGALMNAEPLVEQKKVHLHKTLASELQQFKDEKQLEQAKKEQAKLCPEHQSMPVERVFTREAIVRFSLDEAALKEIETKQSDADNKLGFCRK